MDLQMLSEWLKTELQLAGLKVSPSDSIAEKGFVGDLKWLEIGWRAATLYTENVEIPVEQFRSLEKFEDLLELIVSWHKQVTQRVEVLVAA